VARLRVAALCALGLLLTIGLLPEHPPYVIRPVWRTQGVMDASSFRSAAQLLGGPGLYNPNAVLANQRQQIDQTLDLGSVRVFLRPPWYALAVKWMAWLPYRTAMALWKIGLLVGCALFVLLWRGNRSAAALAVCWSFPIAAALEQGQDTVWLLVLVAAALALVTRGRELSAGFVLSLCFIKFHLLLFLPLLLVGKRFRLAAGFVTGSTVLWAVSTVVQGPSWPLAFLRQLTLPDLHSGITAMPSVAGLVPQWDFRARFILCMVCAFPSESGYTAFPGTATPASRFRHPLPALSW
jgi:glycosyl transferase family 87